MSIKELSPIAGQAFPVSVLYPMQPPHAAPVAPYARIAMAAGAQRIWMGQSLLAEAHQVFAYLAGTGVRLPVGIGVTLLPLRHPYEAAIQARSLAMLTGYPVVAGYGAATPELVAALRGRPYRRPADAAADYLSAVRELLLDGAPVRRSGEAFMVDAALPAAPHPLVELGLGVLRPGMARLAGSVADVAITLLTPPDYIRDVLAPAIAQGATARQPPRITTFVHVAVARAGRDPCRLAWLGGADHLARPHYVEMLRRAGIEVDAADPVAGARALVEAGVFVYGTAAEIAAAVRRHQAVGVTEVVLNLAGVARAEGEDAVASDLAEILTAVADCALGAGQAQRAAGADRPDRHRVASTTGQAQPRG